MDSRVAGESDLDIQCCETPNDNQTKRCPNRALQFEEAWEKNRPELFRRSLKWSSNRPEDAEDALGQAAMAALQKFPPDLCPAEARGWLLRLVYTKCMDIHRERRRIRRLTIESDHPALDGAETATVANLESAVLGDELATVARSALKRLPMHLRAVAELHLFWEMRYPEISERLAISEVAVRKRMQHARALLRRQIKAYLAGDAGAGRTARGTTGGPSGERARSRGRRSAKPRASAPRRSLHALKEYVRRHPRGWKMRWALARRLRESGLLEEAVAQLQMAAGRQPRKAEIWLDLGSVYCSLGRMSEARAAFEVALRWTRDEETRRRILSLAAACCDLPAPEK